MDSTIYNLSINAGSWLNLTIGDTTIIMADTLADHRKYFIDGVWNEDANMFTQTVKVHIKNIRSKLNAAGAGDLISTVKGRGYLL